MTLHGDNLVSELYGGEPYDYYPITEHIVSAPGVCGGRPTFKYTRIDIRHALELVSRGRAMEEIAGWYRIPVVAVREAIELAIRALDDQAA